MKGSKVLLAFVLCVVVYTTYAKKQNHKSSDKHSQVFSNIINMANCNVWYSAIGSVTKTIKTELSVSRSFVGRFVERLSLEASNSIFIVLRSERFYIFNLKCSPCLTCAYK